MKYRALRLTLVILGVSGITLLLRASLPTVATGTWGAAGSMAAARSGACTVVLSDGRLLISGGADAYGPTATADLFSTTGSWSAAAKMSSTRSHQSCAVLQDGHVLVAGGTSSNGVITNSAELYDPSADSWTPAAFLNDARSGATTSVLQDGRVLIAGGQDSGSALNTLEIYDPNSGTFSNAGTMSSPRQDHAAAVLNDGRVLIVGGFDGTNPLASSDIFDPSSGTVSAGPNLATARYAHSATTLLNGLVVAIGGAGAGTNGMVDLASAEIFDPSTGAFTTASATLTTAREGHQAYLLPKNNSVLIEGGTSSGTTLAASELFVPQVNSTSGAWTYAVTPTGSNVTPRNAATGSPIQQDGLLLAAGGTDASGNPLASTELYAFPTVKTDQADYPPGTTVNITGSGFTPGETVTITLVESPLIDTHGPYTITAQQDGTISDSSFTTDSHDVSVRFFLSAVGSKSGVQAQNTFTDSNLKIVTDPFVIPANTCSPVIQAQENSDASVLITLSTTSAGGKFYSDSGCSTQITNITTSASTPSNAVFYYKDSTAGSPTITVADTLGQHGNSATQTETISASLTATTLTLASPSPSSVDFQSSAATAVTLSATLKAGATLLPHESVNFFVDGLFVGMINTGQSGLSLGIATFTYNASGLSIGNHTVQATFEGDNSSTPKYSASTSGTQTLTVNKRTNSTVVICSPSSVNVNSTTTCTASVSDNDTGTTVTPTGNVSFTSSQSGTFSPSGSCTLSGSSATATCSVSYTPTAFGGGTHIVTGSYGGDTTHLPTGGTFNLGVQNPATTTAVTSSLNPSTYGNSVTFTATITPSVGSNGTVDFKDGTNAICSAVAVTASSATCTTSTLAAGSHPSITAVFSGGGGFLSSTSAAFSQTVNHATVTPTVTANNKVYDGTTSATQITCTLSGVLAGDAGNVTCSAGTLAFTDKNVGTGKIVNVSGITLAGTASGNYQLSSTTSTATANITQRAITVTAAANSKSYDGTTSATATPTITSGSLASGDTASFTETYSTKNVGTNLILTPAGTVSDGNNGNNYLVTFASSNNGVITARPITVTAATNTKSYDGTTSAAAVPTITSGSLVTGDTANFTEAYTTKNAGSGLTLVPAGSVSDGNSGNNYAVTLLNNSTGVITARPITVTAGTNTKSYDGTTSAAAVPTLTGGSLVPGDTANFTEAYTTKNAGSGLTLVPAGSVSDGNSGNNYAVTLVNNATGVIMARAITVTASSDTKVYDGTTSSTGTPAITSGTLATGDTASFTQVFDSKNAGSRTLTASGAVNDGNGGNNYTITLKTANGTITARPITVTAATNTKTYDGTTSAAAIPMITSGTLVSGDTASFTEVYSSKNAGSGLTLIPSGAVSDGNGGNNYAVTLVNNTTGVINAVTVTPSITASDKLYDGTTTATLISQTLSGVISGDTVTLTVGAANFSDANAGNGKTVTATGLTLSGASAGNYQLLSATATTTANITRATPAVIVTGGTFTYDAMPHAASAVATGVGGVVVPGFVVFTYTPPGDTTVPVSAGSYSVNAAFTSSNTNYTDSVGAGAIVINQAQLSVTAADASRPYGRSNPAFTGILTGLVAGDGITATYASAASATTAAGVYGPGDPNAIVPTLVDSNNKLSNYNVTSTNGTLTITAIPLLVIANDKTRAFGAADPAFDAQYFSFVNGDTATSSLTGSLNCTPSNSGDRAGSYAIHCDGLSSNNYTLTFVDGTLTVTDPLATIAVTPGSPSATYGSSTTFAAQGAFASSASRTLANAGGAAYQLQDLSTARSGAAEAEGQGKLYAIGGTVSGAVSDTVEVYDPASNNWSAVHNLNNARTSARAASVAGKVYVFGGCGDAACTSLVAKAEVYDSSSNTWAAVSSSGFTPRSSMAVSVIGGKIYVAGGNDNASNALSVVEIYDPGTDTWSSAAPLKTNLGPASGGVVNGTFYVVAISGSKAEVEAFNGTSWSTVNSGVQPLTDVAAAVLNNVIYVVDGANIHAYDPASNTWTDKTSLNTARQQPEPVTIGNLIYVAGDAASSASDANAVESFASDEAQWSSSDTTVSAIDQTGKASALKVGSATITATSIISPAISGSSTLTVSPANVTPVIAVSGKTYDGTTAAAVTSCTVSPVVATDDVACSVGSANFSDKNAGAGKTVTATGITLTGNSASNYMLSSATATTAADISARPLTVVATGVNKVYDGTTSATVILSDNRVTGDVFTDSYTGATFSDKNVGNGKTVSVTGISINGTDAGNYTVNATATTAANITPRTLTVTATGMNKVYDGTATATVTLSTDKLAGDYVNVGYTSATFADKNVANGKTVTVSGVSITGGADAGNYTLNGGSQIATTANITPRTLTVTATGMNKVYDGTTSATVTLSTDKLAGDYVNVGYTSATFSDKTVASGKTVTVSGVSIMGGVDAGNYTLNGVTQIATTANITPRPLTVTATGVNKQYDGTTAATVTFADNRVTGDLFTDSYASATFTDKSVGDSKTVNVTGISISGTDSVNYTFNPTAATTANITSRPLTVTATGMNKQYDGTTAATVTLADNRVTGDLLTDSYASATFSDKNVGNGKAVNVSGISISGTDSVNYTFNPAAATTANITCRPLNVTATGTNKQYDGTTATTVTLADNRVTGDVFTDSYTSATFSDKNVGNGKAVSVSGISISGTDAANYTFNTTAMTTANITARTLTVTATGVNKVYDGTATATVTLLTDKLAGDYVNVGYASATFADKNVGNGKTVTVSGVSIAGGADAGNYMLNRVTQIATTANITPAALTLTVTGASGAYNSLPYTAACSVATGLVNGDSVALTITYSSVTAPVIVGSYTATCTSSGNSNYQTATGQASITITPATTTTGVTSSVNPSTFMQLVTFTASVTPQFAGTTPTGTVTFYNNGVSIGTGTLNQASPDQATLNISSLPDNVSGGDQITATYTGDTNFITSTGALSPGYPTAGIQTVNPSPNVSLNPMSVSFGNTNVGATSSPMTITLSNVGDAALTLNSIVLSDPIDFTESDNCPSSLGYTALNNSCTITLKFKPADTGVISAVLTITDNDDDSTNAQQIVSLTGAGLSTISGGSLYTDALFATSNGCGSILASGGSTVDSFSSVAGYTSSHALNGGNVGTNGNVTLNGGKSMIYGTAAVDSMLTGNCSKGSVTGITATGGAQVTSGAVKLNGPITYPAPPAPSPAPPTTTQNISGSCGSITGCTNTGTKTVSLAPGQYGNLSISGGTTAHFSTGIYNINSLTLSGNSVLYVDPVPVGPVVVNLAGASLSGSNPAMDASGGSIQNPSGKPSNLQFTYAGSRGLTLSGGSWSYATVYAPNALVNMSGGTDFFGSIIGGTITASGGTATHFDTSLADIQPGSTIWLTAVVNNVGGLPASNQVKLYLTNSSIQFSGGGMVYNVPVPNAVVTFNSAAQGSGAKTTYDLSNNRWSTAVAKTGLTGNTFVAGVAFKVPSDFPTGIQNAAWSASFSTDTPGVNLQWQWGAAVYGSALTAVCTSVDPNFACSASTYATVSPSNTNVLGVNAEDGSANASGTDPAGTPESYKASVTFGATGGGLTNYTGYRSSAAAVVPTIAPMSVSPSSLDFFTQNQGTTTAIPLTAVLTNNDSNTHNFTGSGIQLSGTNAADFTLVPNGPGTPNNCLAMSNLASGASCTLYATFTPADVGTRTAKIALNDDANNSPQTVYLSGTGQ